MSSQCSSVPIVNASGPLHWGFSCTHCVNTSSCLCEWLDDFATCHLFDLVGPTRSSSAQNKQDPVSACEGEVIPHSPASLCITIPPAFRHWRENVCVLWQNAEMRLWQDRASGCNQRGWLHISQVRGKGHPSMFGKVKNSQHFGMHLKALGHPNEVLQFAPHTCWQLWEVSWLELYMNIPTK